MRKIWQSCCHKFYPPAVPHCVFQLLSQMAHVRFHRRKWVLTRLRQQDRTQRPTRRNRGVSDGALSLPSERSARSQTSPGRVSERRTLPLLGLGRERSRRTQKAFGTAMRLCVSLSRGVAAPLGCVIFSLLPKLRLVHPALSAFRMCETRGGITTLGALHVLLKRWAAACQNGSFAVF